MFTIISITLAIVIAVLGFIATRLQKRRMRIALGRDVNNNDLTSINSWIAVSEAEDRREQNKKY